MPRTTDAPGGAGLHAALHRLAHSTYSSHWPRIEPDYGALKAALYELAEARPVVAAVAAYGAAIGAVDRAAYVRAGTYRDKESFTDADYARACADHAAASETEQAALRELRGTLRAWLVTREELGEG